ncbi:MAG: cysteine desulfurase-like protein [Gammaproteobacteria bacterium RBG_16_66_13]|nr:MAG: cysteine desulfurase-like protein [Gammaproteobacteria bacterium RBG_16_66_13]
MALEPHDIRRQFPSLQTGAVFFDNPGGTQVPQRVIDRISTYLTTSNANRDGAFSTSRASDTVIEAARGATAAFLHAASPEEIVFGPNMTTLTLGLSRALSRTFLPGDEIIVTHLDHDANISPWLHIAEDRGCLVRWLDFDVEDCTLRLDQLDRLLSPRTRLVAVGYASNAVGTINPVADIVRRAHQAGALCFVDAVQFAPHGVIDVRALDCDFLAVSAYKFFGPHLGALYGKLEHLTRLRPYKVRPASSSPPGSFETGTGIHENIAGTLGALEYLASLGEGTRPDRAALAEGMHVIQTSEAILTRALLDSLERVPGVHIWGLTDRARLRERVPTVSFTMEGIPPRVVAEHLAAEGIHAWDGNFYALAVTERLGLEPLGGLIRVGLVHYNLPEEIDRLERALRSVR